MESLRPNSSAIVLVPASRSLARRPGRTLAVRAASVLPALVATPQRALFTAGVAFGLAGPPVLRFLAERALSGALRSLAPRQPKPTPATHEIVIERIFATRIVIRRRG
ncbi:MAG: hypothetical protein HY690_08530 [Chloroflexi bacterium]|nr:hypothetical protein [Chloroflexota bacterium]